MSGQRLTYLLRPNVTRPDFHATASLETPPVTDIDYSSQIDSESDVIDSRSEAGESDAELEVPDPGSLSPISENLVPSSSHAPHSAVLEPMDDEAWSIFWDTDAEGDESGSEASLAASIDSLSFQGDPDRTFCPDLHTRQTFIHPRSWHHRRGRSPSHSPARRPSRQVHLHPDPRSKNQHQDYFIIICSRETVERG